VSVELERIRGVLSSRRPFDLTIDNFRPSAVLVPLQFIDGRPHLVFTQRSGEVENHKHQVSFPGGAIEPDEGPLQCALRETEEEIGVDPRHVSVLGRLDEIFTITNYTITPFVGVLPHPYEFQANPFEIAEVFDVSIEHLLRPEICRVEMTEAPWGAFPIYYYETDRYTIWGATARILTQFLRLAYGKQVQDNTLDPPGA